MRHNIYSTTALHKTATKLELLYNAISISLKKSR